MNMKTKMKKQTQLRQGDVWLELVDFRPGEFKNMQHVARENGLLILARGEATGHHHAIADHDVDMFTATAKDGATVTMLEVRQALAMLKHQEHDVQKITRTPEGKRWQVQIQRAYTPQAIRPVMD